jgi:hypothetical protein
LLHAVWPSQGAADGSNRSAVFYDIRDRRIAHPQEYLSDSAHLLSLMAAGRVTPSPAESLPLAQAADSHRRIARGGLDHRLVLVP